MSQSNGESWLLIQIDLSARIQLWTHALTEGRPLPERIRGPLSNSTHDTQRSLSALTTSATDHGDHPPRRPFACVAHLGKVNSADLFLCQSVIGTFWVKIRDTHTSSNDEPSCAPAERKLSADALMKTLISFVPPANFYWADLFLWFRMPSLPRTWVCPTCDPVLARLVAGIFEPLAVDEGFQLDRSGNTQ